MVSDKKEVMFGPNHHAELFGIIARNALEIDEKKGRDVVLEGVKRYALQRGLRMRKRAIKNGDPLTMSTYRAYCEWIAPTGSIDRVTIQKSPVHVTRNFACPWHTYWNAHGLLAEGYLYCKHIDEYLVKGFNSDLVLRVNAVHTDGNSRFCEFEWHGIDLTLENEAAINKMREKVKDEAVRNWEYHIGHLYVALGKTIIEQLNNGEEVMRKSKEEFISRYGDHAAKTLAESYRFNFEEID